MSGCLPNRPVHYHFGPTHDLALCCAFLRTHTTSSARSSCDRPHTNTFMKKAFATAALLLFAGSACAQSLGNAGTIEGTVVDPSGALVPEARITIANSVTGYKQTLDSGQDGSFRLTNIPPNSYHLTVSAPAFSTFALDVTIRSSVPVQVKAILPVAEAVSSVYVEASGGAVVETDPSAHVDVDRSAFDRLPTSSPGGGLS